MEVDANAERYIQGYAAIEYVSRIHHRNAIWIMISRLDYPIANAATWINKFLQRLPPPFSWQHGKHLCLIEFKVRTHFPTFEASACSPPSPRPSSRSNCSMLGSLPRKASGRVCERV